MSVLGKILAFSLKDHSTRLQNIGVMGQMERLSCVLLYQEYGSPTFVEVDDGVENLLNNNRRESERRLIQHEELRTGHESTSDR